MADESIAVINRHDEPASERLVIHFVPVGVWTASEHRQSGLRAPSSALTGPGTSEPGRSVGWVSECARTESLIMGVFACQCARSIVNMASLHLAYRSPLILGPVLLGPQYHKSSIAASNGPLVRIACSEVDSANPDLTRNLLRL